MKVDLSKLFVTPGGRQEFSCALDLGETKRLGRPLFLGPVRVSGAAENRSGDSGGAVTVQWAELLRGAGEKEDVSDG